MNMLYRGKMKTAIDGKNEWLYGYLSVRYGNYYIGFENKLTHQWQDLEVIGDTVGVKTDICDINGNELYTDDILKCKVYGIAIVKFYDGSFQFGNKETANSLDDGYFLHSRNFDILKIGNKFDDPLYYELINKIGKKKK